MTAPAARPAEPGEVVVRARGLSKRYGEHLAVDRLDLDVRAGEVFGLLGPNGAGKTTTILMLLGLTERSDGEVAVLGLDPAREPLRVKRRVGYLPDDVGFYGNLTGRENLRYTARLNGMRGPDTEERLQALLEEVGLAEAADRRVEEYSRGMRQRLGIADALVKDPAVVILDEPTIAIDPAGVAEILAIIRGLAVERGAAVLLSSHLLHQVQDVCDRVGIFVRGRMVAEGRIDELAAAVGAGPARVEVEVDDPARAREVVAGFAGARLLDADVREPRRVVVELPGEQAAAFVWALADARVPVTSVRRRDTELDALYQHWFTEDTEEVAHVR